MSPRQNNRKRRVAANHLSEARGRSSRPPRASRGRLVRVSPWRNPTWPEAWSYHRHHTGGLCTFWLQPCISTRHRSCLARPVEEKRREGGGGGEHSQTGHKQCVKYPSISRLLLSANLNVLKMHEANNNLALFDGCKPWQSLQWCYLTSVPQPPI